MDGLLYFYETKDARRKIIAQVKGGGVKCGDPDKSGLPGDVNNQKAAGGILLMLEKPITTMRLICFIARCSPVVPLRSAEPTREEGASDVSSS